MAQRRLSLKILLVKFCSNTSAVRTLAYNHNSGLCDRYRLLAGHLSAILLNINVTNGVSPWRKPMTLISYLSMACIHTSYGFRTFV
ncbi:MAG: hypothetical protein ACJAT8_002084 [Cellvibrionaceae bacterium]|jgi:hypothetical protein